MRAEQVPARLRTLAEHLEAGPSHVAHIPDELREAAEALEAERDRPPGGQHVDAQVHVMRYLDSARTQLEQGDDLELPAPITLESMPHDVRYAIERAALVGRAVDDLIDAVHVLNGSTNAEARELVERQRAREAQAGLFDRTDGVTS